jgi:hypothetical protein
MPLGNTQASVTGTPLAVEKIKHSKRLGTLDVSQPFVSMDLQPISAFRPSQAGAGATGAQASGSAIGDPVTQELDKQTHAKTGTALL